jgi:hypothetical protein
LIPLLVFYAHVVAIAAGFTKRWQEEGVSEGVLAVFFMALIFFVGWSMASFIMKLVVGVEGWGKGLDRDAASILLLSAAEVVFYFFYLRGGAAGPGASPAPEAER